MLFRKRMSLIAMAVLVCVLMTAFAGCSKNATETTAAPTETAATEAATEAQQAVVIDESWQQEESGSLKAWKLTPKAWSSNNGATVSLTAQPREYAEGMSASFIVRLNGEEAENKSCDWDGSAFVTAVDLSAEDGYEYEFVLNQPWKQGDPIVPGEHITLTDAYMNLANLKSSLEPACTLLVDDYKVDNDAFEILACYATVRLPQLSAEGTEISIQKSEMLLKLNGETVETKALELKPDEENAGSFTASGAAISFPMPKMEDDYNLELSMVITLSNGEQMDAQGGIWYYNNGALSTMNAG